MSILTAINRGCKGTLVDGTVRYMIEFGPLDAVAAATLFAMPGTEMGVVALKDGRDHTEDVLDMVPRALNVVFGDETTAVRTNGAGLHDEPNDQIFEAAKKAIKAGKTITLANYAGMFCNDPQFWRFFHDGYREDIRIDTEEICKFAIYEHCGIRSRAELDHNKDAAQSFREVMSNFDQWKGAQK